MRLLPKDVYDAAVGANTPSSSNVFATMADIGGGTPSLSAVLTVGDTGTAGQNIHLVGGLLDISNNAAGPSLSKLEFTSSVGEAQIRTTGISGAGQDLRLKTSSIGKTVILEGLTTIGIQGFKVGGLGFNGIFAMSPTQDRTYTFKNASGTVAFITDITVNAVAQTYTITGGTPTDRAFDYTSTNPNEIAEVLATLITDLKTSGIIL